jgi:capsular polysaccharide biosynthesis protein
MSQQTLDLRRSVHIVRRHKVLVGVLVVTGILVGCAYSVLFPAKLTATAYVVLPQTSQSAAAAAANTDSGSADGYIATQQVIASSTAVLAAALPHVRPAMSLVELRDSVQIGSPTSYIISVNAQAKNAADAEATANAVARSYIAYVDSPSSPIGHVSASLLESATTATGRGPAEMLIVCGLIGALVGAVIGVIAAIAVSRKDRRLRRRDEIANSIGLPVIASLPVAHPSSAAGWAQLLQKYRPTAVHAWRLRVVLQRLRRAGGPAGNGFDSGGTSVLVLSLSSDPGALALGPQLAAFAASLEIPTTLVIGPQQDRSAAAALRTACALAAGSDQLGQLRIGISEDGDLRDVPDADLRVVVATVDGLNPQMPETIRTTTTVLAVSAGAATADQLARVAVNATADDRDIAGILVADPEPDDNTTGQVPQLVKPVQHRKPARLNRLTTEIRR